VYHIRNPSAGTAAPITVEKVSIPKYGPLSNDDAAVARTLLRGGGGRDRTLGCCGGEMQGSVCCGGGGGGGDGRANVMTGWEAIERKV
jgi:hypothetical protein